MKKRENLQRPDFYHIPLIVAEKVTPHESFVWSVIYWFEKMKDGKCYASNKKIAEALPYPANPMGITNALLTLEKNKLIRRTYKDGLRRTRDAIFVTVSYRKVSSSGDRGVPPQDVPPQDGMVPPQDGIGTTTGWDQVPPQDGQSSSNRIVRNNSTAFLPKTTAPRGASQSDAATPNVGENISAVSVVGASHPDIIRALMATQSIFPSEFANPKKSPYANTTTRNGAASTVKAHGLEVVVSVASSFASMKTNKYAPTANNINSFFSKFDAIKTFVEKEGSKLPDGLKPRKRDYKTWTDKK